MTDETSNTTGRGDASRYSSEPAGISETLQSLLVAFVIAMTARGFVLEGFVIPTGSMAPTLMGSHVRWSSPQTGWSYAIDSRGYMASWLLSAKILQDANRAMLSTDDIEARKRIGRAAMRKALTARWDPMFGLMKPVERVRHDASKPRPLAGDRVIVLKTLFPISSPDRYDVVVFKNPTDPVGDTQNFIKRLVGLPEEQLVIVDGDIFTGPLDASPADLIPARKPEYIQRAVWQPIYNSSYQPIAISKWEEEQRSDWWGAPFQPRDSAGSWTIGTDRAWNTDQTGPTMLEWDSTNWPITDVNSYNIYPYVNPTAAPLSTRPYSMSDLRVLGTLDPDDPAAFASTSLTMEARGLRYEWILTRGHATLRMTRLSDGKELATKTAAHGFRGQAFEVDFWNVDQQMWLFVDDELIVQLPFDGWSPLERFEASFPGTSVESYLADPRVPRPEPARLSWSFDTGPLALRNVQVARDLYYRPKLLDDANQYEQNGRKIRGNGFGTDFLKPSRIESDQFVMFGDNSEASRDGRIWGRPHPLSVKYSGDDSPFVVPRKLLVGKAFCVYWPAAMPVTEGGWHLIPDFGQVRFIR